LAYKDQGVLFIGVFAMSKVDEIKDFAAKYHLTYPVGPEKGIAEALGVRGIPELVYISKDGSVLKHHSGVISYEELERDIKELLNQ